MEKLRCKLSYANVMATLGVFIALGGTTYAATQLDKNEVKSKHIKNAGVKNADLANDAVTSPKVANGSLLGEDFAAGQLPQGPKGDRGPQGLQGVEGPRGPAGRTACPSGMTRLGTTALCYETTHRAAASPTDAHAACAEQRRSLPTLAEADAISRVAPGEYWTNVLYYRDTASQIVGVSWFVNPSTRGTNSADTSSAYRCITYASDQ